MGGDIGRIPTNECESSCCGYNLEYAILFSRLILCLAITCLIIKRLWGVQKNINETEGVQLIPQALGDGKTIDTSSRDKCVGNFEEDEELLGDYKNFDSIEGVRLSTSERRNALNFVDLSLLNGTKGSIFSASSFNSYAGGNRSYLTNKSTDVFLSHKSKNEEGSPSLNFSDLMDSPVRKEQIGLVETPKSIYRAAKDQKKSRFLF